MTELNGQNASAPRNTVPPSPVDDQGEGDAISADAVGQDAAAPHDGPRSPVERPTPAANALSQRKRPSRAPVMGPGAAPIGSALDAARLTALVDDVVERNARGPVAERGNWLALVTALDAALGARAGETWGDNVDAHTAASTRRAGSYAPDWGSVEQAVVEMGVGASAKILWDESHGEGRALAIHHSADGIRWIDLTAPPGERVTAARPTLPVSGARVSLTDTTDHEIRSPSPTIREPDSTARSVDNDVDARYGGGRTPFSTPLPDLTRPPAPVPPRLTPVNAVGTRIGGVTFGSAQDRRVVEDAASITHEPTEQRILQAWMAGDISHHFAERSHLVAALRYIKKWHVLGLEPLEKFSRDNLWFITKAQGREPTPHFRHELKDGRIRQQHPKGPAPEWDDRSEHYFFADEQEFFTFLDVAEAAKSLKTPLTEAVVGTFAYSGVAIHDSRHIEIIYGENYVPTMIHWSVGRVVTDLSGWDDAKIAELYCKAVGLPLWLAHFRDSELPRERRPRELPSRRRRVRRRPSAPPSPGRHNQVPAEAAQAPDMSGDADQPVPHTPARRSDRATSSAAAAADEAAASNGRSGTRPVAEQLQPRGAALPRLDPAAPARGGSGADKPISSLAEAAPAAENSENAENTVRLYPIYGTDSQVVGLHVGRPFHGIVSSSSGQDSLLHAEREFLLVIPEDYDLNWRRWDALIDAAAGSPLLPEPGTAWAKTIRLLYKGAGEGRLDAERALATKTGRDVVTALGGTRLERISARPGEFLAPNRDGEDPKSKAFAKAITVRPPTGDGSWQLGNYKPIHSLAEAEFRDELMIPDLHGETAVEYRRLRTLPLVDGLTGFTVGSTAPDEDGAVFRDTSGGVNYAADHYLRPTEATTQWATRAERSAILARAERARMPTAGRDYYIASAHAEPEEGFRQELTTGDSARLGGTAHLQTLKQKASFLALPKDDAILFLLSCEPGGHGQSVANAAPSMEVLAPNTATYVSAASEGSHVVVDPKRPGEAGELLELRAAPGAVVPNVLFRMVTDPTLPQYAAYLHGARGAVLVHGILSAGGKHIVMPDGGMLDAAGVAAWATAHPEWTSDGSTPVVLLTGDDGRGAVAAFAEDVRACVQAKLVAPFASSTALVLFPLRSLLQDTGNRLIAGRPTLAPDGPLSMAGVSADGFAGLNTDRTTTEFGHDLGTVLSGSFGAQLIAPPAVPEEPILWNRVGEYHRAPESLDDLDFASFDNAAVFYGPNLDRRGGSSWDEAAARRVRDRLALPDAFVLRVTGDRDGPGGVPTFYTEFGESVARRNGRPYSFALMLSKIGWRSDKPLVIAYPGDVVSQGLVSWALELAEDVRRPIYLTITEKLTGGRLHLPRGMVLKPEVEVFTETGSTVRETKRSGSLVVAGTSVFRFNPTGAGPGIPLSADTGLRRYQVPPGFSDVGQVRARAASRLRFLTRLRELRPARRTTTWISGSSDNGQAGIARGAEASRVGVSPAQSQSQSQSQSQRPAAPLLNLDAAPAGSALGAAWPRALVEGMAEQNTREPLTGPPAPLRPQPRGQQASRAPLPNLDAAPTDGGRGARGEERDGGTTGSGDRVVTVQGASSTSTSKAE